MCISGVYSLSKEIDSTDSGLSTSAVDFDIKNYNHDNEIFSENGKVVMPGEKISIIPRINNLGIECYLRAKISYIIDDEQFDVLNYIDGDYSSWTIKDEYYYYNSVLGKDESVDLFNQITIPDTLSSIYQGKNVVIQIVVDAVQAKNFDGNWNDVTIKKSINRSYNIDYTGESSIIYEDNIKSHITLNEHFFDNLGNLVPGDRISNKIILLNTSHDRNEYFLTINYNDLDNEEQELLKNINLVIKDSKGKILANDNLKSKVKHSLGTYAYKEGDELTIELSLPSYVDNDYSKLFTKVIWDFSYNVINHYENPSTGDFKFDMSITAFLFSTIGFLIVLLFGKRNDDEIEKNEEVR